MGMRLNTIFDIMDLYDTYLVDVWGVIHDGVHPFEEAVCALNALKQQQKTVIFVSNNPRPGGLVQAGLQEMGVDGEPEVITSGDVMRDILINGYAGKQIYHLSKGRNQDILKDLDVTEVSNLDQSDLVLLSCFLEEDEDPFQFDLELKAIAQSEQPVYCPNPDIYAAHHQTLRKTSGYFARRLEQEFGGKAIRIGKPDRSIFDFTRHKYPRAFRQTDRVLMIGDTLGTDIKGGHDFGIKTLFIESGISGKLADCVEREPTYTMKKLK